MIPMVRRRKFRQATVQRQRVLSDSQKDDLPRSGGDSAVPSLAGPRLISRAKQLGIRVPPKATASYLRERIDEHLAEAASPAQKYVAKDLGVRLAPGRVLTRSYVTEAIDRRLMPAGSRRNSEILTWWVMSVACHLLNTEWRATSQHPLSVHYARQLAATLQGDSDLTAQILREYEQGYENRRYDVVVFGDGFNGTLSKVSSAYAATRRKLFEANDDVVARGVLDAIRYESSENHRTEQVVGFLMLVSGVSAVSYLGYLIFPILRDFVNALLNAA